MPNLTKSLVNHVPPWYFFLGPGVLVLPLVAAVRPYARKNRITYIQASIPLNQQKTHQINPMAPWDALKAPLDPVKPLFPNLLDLPGPLNSPLNLIGPLRSPRLPYKLSEDPSNVADDPMGHIQLPLDPLWPCRPTSWPEAQKPKTFQIATCYVQKLSGPSAWNRFSQQA